MSFVSQKMHNDSASKPALYPVKQTHSHRVISASPTLLPHPSAPGVSVVELLVLRDGAPVNGLTLHDGMTLYMPAPWLRFASAACAKSA